MDKAGEAAELAAFQVRSSWQPIQGQIDHVMDVVISDDDPSDGSSDSIVDFLSLAPRSMDSSGPCEITVAFQHRLCHVRSISILSSSRQCELYSQAQLAGDVEYICTARGTLEEDDDDDEGQGRKTLSCSSSGHFYEAVIELIDAHAWAAVKMRLLSLEDPCRADVKRITLCAKAGEAARPTIADEQQSWSSSNSSSSSLLTMLMPSVLQIVRGMSDGIESRQAAAAQAQSPKKIAASKPAEAAAAAAAQHYAETSFRLQRLEMAIGRMEVFLQGAFSKVEDRMSSIEAHISMLEQQQQQQYRQLLDGIKQTSIPPAQAPIPSEVLPDETKSGRQLRNDQLDDQSRAKDGDGDGDPGDERGVEEDQEDDDDGEVNEESSPSISGSVSGGDGDDDDPAGSSSGNLEEETGGSMTLEDAWASALAAFSVSVVPAPAAPPENEEHTSDAFEDAVAEVSAERTDEEGKEEKRPGNEDNEIATGELEDPAEESNAEKVVMDRPETEEKEKESGRPDEQPTAGSGEVDLIDFQEAEVVPRISSSGGEEEVSPDSVLIDCLDGAYLMQHKERGVGLNVHIASPSVDSEADLICIDSSF